MAVGPVSGRAWGKQVVVLPEHLGLHDAVQGGPHAILWTHAGQFDMASLDFTSS